MAFLFLFSFVVKQIRLGFPINVRANLVRPFCDDATHCRYNLRLERNEHLIRPGNKVRVWFADSPDDASAVDSTTTSRSSSRNSSFAYGGIKLEELTQVSDR